MAPSVSESPAKENKFFRLRSGERGVDIVV
jgi:hypothetical protein